MVKVQLDLPKETHLKIMMAAKRRNSNLKEFCTKILTNWKERVKK